MKSNTLYILAIICSLLISCEEKINPTLQQADAVLVVDAWINNLPQNQIITLTQTQPYFDNTNPAGVTGATVVVTDNKGTIFSFTEDVNNAGNYVWQSSGDGFGEIGNTYHLTINLKNEIFQSVSRMGRVPLIDSITFDKDDRATADKPDFRGEFWATDMAGAGDTYWIKAYKNGVLSNKPSEINIAYDAGNSAGGDADGVTFITPIRRGINSNDEDAQKKRISPFTPGDSVNVQIHSITHEAFGYLNQVITQTDRPGGFQELFSKPLANVSTNITNTNANGPVALGFFNVSAVSSFGKRFR